MDKLLEIFQNLSRLVDLSKVNSALLRRLGNSLSTVRDDSLELEDRVRAVVQIASDLATVTVTDADDNAIVVIKGFVDGPLFDWLLQMVDDLLSRRATTVSESDAPEVAGLSPALIFAVAKALVQLFMYLRNRD